MDIRDIFAQNIRNIRRQRGISQEELASLADIDRTYVSALERSVYSASLDVVASIADALDVEPHELLLKSRRNRT
jgi:transcriptional regulator with XRE-family HTH domain